MKTIELKEKIIRSFSCAAHRYDSACRIQQYSAKRLMDHILVYQKEEYPSILELGCGTGLFTQELVTVFPESQFLISDICRSMLTQCKKRILKEDLIFQEIDMENIDVNEKFSLIVGSFCFHWVEDLLILLDRLKKQLRPRGKIAFSIPLSSSFSEWKGACTKVHAPYTARNLPEKDCFFSTLYKNWDNVQIEVEEKMIEYASSIDFFRSMKRTGAHAVSQTILSFKEFKNIIQAWDKEGSFCSWDMAYVLLTNG